MTISSTTRIAGPFVGNGTASVFPFTFKVFAAADLDVIRLTVSTGVESPLILTTDYTVSLNGNQNTNPGGSITLVAGALAAGYTLTITSDIANLQPTDLTNQGGFYPEVITDSLDRATIQIQQISDIGDRTIKTPISDGTLNMELPSATNRASKYLTFDANGLPTVSSGSGTDTALRTDLANATVALAGSSLVGFRATAASSTARTTLDKLRDVISVKDFGATGDGTTDDTTAFTNAIAAAGTRDVFVPGATYVITGTLTGNFYTDSTVTISGGTVNTIKRTNIFVAAGSGASQRTVQDKLRDIVSVKDFGAVGNGTTDDTAAFNAAWTASNPNEVFVPAGSYAVTGSITGKFFSLANATVVGGTIPGLQSALFTNANALINGDFQVAQRGTSITSATTPYANNDDDYVLDRWYILSDGNDAIDVTQNTADAPFTGGYCIALDVETINKKFGIAQIIEKQNLNGLLGQTVTLSFKAKVSSTTKLDNVKCAIVAWSGTADTVTSDIVSAWGVEGTNPTLIANATYENTPSNLGVTTSWKTFTVTAAVDTASANNVIVFIWSDVTDTTLGDFLYVTDVKLEAGSVATPYQREPFSTALLRCQRYFVSAINTSGLAWHDLIKLYTAYTAGGGVGYLGRLPFRVPMRAIPTATKFGTWSASASNSTQPAVNEISINSIEFLAQSLGGGSASTSPAASTGWYASIEM